MAPGRRTWPERFTISHVRRVYQWHWNTTKAGGIPIPVTHVFACSGRWSAETAAAMTSQTSELDDIGCIACQKTVASICSFTATALSATTGNP